MKKRLSTDRRAVACRKHKSSRLRRTVLAGLWLALAAGIGIGGYFAGRYYGVIQPKPYSAPHFNIETVYSGVDFNGNGTDDYTDILLGARSDAQNVPKYDPSYFAGGYPPDNAGVCTDLIWRAFRNAGYNLKGMIDRDIAANPELYPRVEGTPDPNIDFRRVPNLRVYFTRFAQPLTTDIHDIAQWQPGDIVTFGDRHVGIISDKRNRTGVAYLIHNAGQPVREEDVLGYYTVSGHFRFDADKIAATDLIAWMD